VSFMPLAAANFGRHSDPVTVTTRDDTSRRPRLHWAWVVAAVSFVAILGAAGFRSVPGVMMNPLHHEFGWSHGTVGLAMSVNMTLFGLTAPFAAALMDRLGVRPVLSAALVLIATGSALSVVMTTSWQLVLLWGVLVGVGTGAISMGFVATVSTRWFEERRGLVTGVLTAASATGQLIFLPVVAEVTTRHGWRWASLIVAAAALSVVPLVLLFMRNYPQDMGLKAYGATDSVPAEIPTGSFRAAFDGLSIGARVPAFWLLAGSFAICGMTTNGLIGTHFIPAANDHGMPSTVAAGLLATIGVLDVAGTVFSGWLTDRVDPRLLLVVYYAGRGVSLLLLPSLLSPTRNRAPGCSSSSTAWTGWPRCRRPSCCAGTTSAPAHRWSSGGCSPPTSSARQSPPREPAGFATCAGTTTSRSTSRQVCVRLPRYSASTCETCRSAPA
jgi:MFS family permease